ncbi:MAG TPA: lipoprotein [Gammaproteobacteria bacterium]
MNHNNFIKSIIGVVVVLVALLAGCGQKGELYLPEEEAKKQQAEQKKKEEQEKKKTETSQEQPSGPAQ